MKKLVFDIETDGLEATVMWMIVIADVSNPSDITQTAYSDHYTYMPSIAAALEELKSADVLIGHNIIGYDIPVIDKLCGTTLLTNSLTGSKPTLHDTWIMSMISRFSRTFTQHHSLKDWGEHLGYSKTEFDPSYFARGDEPAIFDEMLAYCMQDVSLNVKVYKALLTEYQEIAVRRPSIKHGMRAEHDTAIFNQLVKRNGWNYDHAKAEVNHKLMSDKMGEIEEIIEPELGTHESTVDKDPKLVRFTANGKYHSATARMLSELLQIDVSPDSTDIIPKHTKFQRTTSHKIRLGQIAYLKSWLLGRGWSPTEYTKKKISTGGFVNVSPKLTEDSLSQIGPIGAMVSTYLTTRNRRSILEGWDERLVDNRLHGNMWTVGTPTFRCRHEAIVNLPGVHAPFGKEVRELLKADEGMVLVGADSSGNQLRALCHYVNNPAFTEEVCFGDQHQRNADALGCSRASAKEYLYAYLFGAGDGKLGFVLTGQTNVKVGKESRAKFAASIKGLSELREKLVVSWRHNSSQFVSGLDGRLIFCKYEHQLLNYLLQSAEGITCKAAVSYAMRKIKLENLRAEPRLFYHDEICYQAHPDDADRVGEILKQSFEEAPKMFNVNCMAGGDYVCGDSYAEVH